MLIANKLMLTRPANKSHPTVHATKRANTNIPRFR